MPPPERMEQTLVAVVLVIKYDDATGKEFFLVDTGGLEPSVAARACRTPRSRHRTDQRIEDGDSMLALGPPDQVRRLEPRNHP